MKYLKLFNDTLLANLKELSMEECGKLFMAVTLYSSNSSLTDEERRLYLSGDARFAFANLKMHIDTEMANYESRAERNRVNGAKHTAKTPEAALEKALEQVLEPVNPVGPSGTHKNPVGSFGLQDKDKDKEKENILSLSKGANRVSDTAGTTTNVMPSIDEVKAYYAEIQSQRPDLDSEQMAEKFFGYYETFQEQDRKPWRPMAYSWFVNEKKSSTSSKRKPRTKKGMGADAPYQQKRISGAEFDALFDDLSEGDFDFDETVE